MERYRIQPEASVYFLTYSVVDWLPIFVNAKTCGTVTDSLAFCHKHKNLGINAYVIMPTHIHLIAFDREFDNQRLERTLTDFRKFTGRQLSDLCGSHFPACFAEVFREECGGY